MARQRVFIGIDGCRAGWFCVRLTARGVAACVLAPDAHAVGELAVGADCALIDIPIGLVAAGTDGRACDREARRRLGARASSVFSPPARATLAATDYAQALLLNRQATGRGLSLQAWNIVPKIRAIDALLDARPALRGVLRECHPELCFHALQGGRPLVHNKKQAAGREERLALLERYLPAARACYAQACAAFPRGQVARDDVIDALVCAVTARSGFGNYRTLPALPPTDARGLVMEIVYCDGRRA